MTTSAIISSSAGCYTSTKSSLSTPKSSLKPSSHISFNTHFSKSVFPLKTHSKSSLRTTPIKAAMADTLYVNTQSYYNLLGISENGTIKEIKKAYKQLARKYHPDVSPPGKTEEYTRKFIQVQEAYETLSDPKSRALYDRDMASGLGLHANVSARSRRYGEGFDDVNEWEQRWQSQLSELIRRSNAKDFENLTWGDRMRSKHRNYSN